LVRRAPASCRGDSGGGQLSAQIIRLSDHKVASETELTIDLRTAVDVAIRDLREIQSCWGTDVARERLVECQDMLQKVLAAS
jgi:hypothetical protein